MRFETCNLIDDNGTVMVAGVAIELHIRNKELARREELSLWHGKIDNANSIEVWPEISWLTIPKTSGGVIVIRNTLHHRKNVDFEGVSDPPVLRIEDFDTSSISKCDECDSNFYRDVSMMSGLCPECAHHIYGYPNCFHEFDGGECVLCKWNGATSDYLRSVRHKT